MIVVCPPTGFVPCECLDTPSESEISYAKLLCQRMAVFLRATTLLRYRDRPSKVTAASRTDGRCLLDLSIAHPLNHHLTSSPIASATYQQGTNYDGL